MSLCLLLSARALAGKEIALTFDDAPWGTTKQFVSARRTEELIRKLKVLDVAQVLVFANPCDARDSAAVVQQLSRYRAGGHLVGNHTCTHPRFDEVGFDKFSADAQRADALLAPLMMGAKFFRFPFLNEGKDPKARDRMRAWLGSNGYRNGLVSVDDDDYLFSFKLNQAEERGKKIDYDKVRALFVDHVAGAADFYEALAVKTLGRSPKHVLLLHERDATVLYIDSLVRELRRRGWTIIRAEDAYRAPIYSSAPQNTYANNGIIAQLALEKTGVKSGYDQFGAVKSKLDSLLGP